MFAQPPIRVILRSAAAVIAITSLSAAPKPIHRYSFSETSGTGVADSVGARHGTVRGAGATWGGGELRLPGGSSASAAYVDLPNGLISGLTDVSFEAWTTNRGTQNWARIFDFGSTVGGELSGPGGGGEGLDYIILSASRGGDNNLQRVEIRNEDPGGGGIRTADANLPSSNGIQYHHVVTFDADGAGGQAQIRYFRDGVLVSQTETGIQLDQLNDVNNWLGRSNWTGDENYNGSFDEFRLYDTALDQAEVIGSNAAGPDALGAGPSIDSFTASPAATFEGDPSALAWSITSVTGALTISIDPGPGVIFGSPASGSITVAPLATTTYTLTATDEAGSSSTGVDIVVDPGIPVADDQELSTNELVPKGITLTARDPNNGVLSYSIVRQPAAGRLSGSPPDLLYTPDPGFVGVDNFAFMASDGSHESNVATVSISVFAAPVAPSKLELTSLEIPATAVAGSFIADIIATDANSQDTHTFSLVPGEGDADNARFATSVNDLLAQSDFAAEVGRSFNIRLRVTDNTGRWFESVFVLTVVEASSAIVINEIHYDPADPTSRAEFIELYNPGTSAADLSGWSLAGGLGFTFPAGTSLGAGGHLVVAQDPTTILTLYGVAALGPWVGRLDGDGDEVVLRDAGSRLIDVVDYKVGFPWPVAASGDGGSMELLNPSLDNDLGSSWRVSRPPSVLPEATLIPLASPTWSWRPGDSEASSPIPAWRQPSFTEDGSWSVPVQTPIGYGSVNGMTLNTNVSGMSGNYGCLFLRNAFSILPGEMPVALQLRASSDDGIVVWINGVEVARQRVDGEPLISGFASGPGPEGVFETTTIESPAGFLVEGLNTIAVQLFNSSLGSSDLGFDLELVRPATGQRASIPTPGARNSIFTSAVPPNIRQVVHLPQEPAASQPVLITAKVTDPDGVSSVDLLYQIVAPGQFIPARTPRTVAQILADPEGDPPLNPAFEDPANWTALPMRDDGSGGDLLAGDGIYSASLPGHPNRTLVRYRISVADLGGASVRVPFPDDASLNFAYFVYDGVPDYVAAARSVHPDGAGHIWPKETLTSVPVYHWLIRPQDMQTLQAYNGSEQFSNNGSAAELAARRAYDWEGAMVYDGVVYDHIHARLRGGNSRYGDFDGRFPRGKRHYKFKFNRGYYFAAKDEMGRPYERKWSIFNVSRMFGTKGGNSWGLPEEIGDKLYHTMGVPTQRAHWFHFRVVDGAAEAPDQYNGDFWGIQQAQERYDVRFLESRDMAKGNLYKLSDYFFDADSQRRYQAQDMVSDGSEFDNIRFNLHGSQDASWLNQYVNYEKWYGYSAVGEAIRHYDIFPEPSGRHRLKNLVWYFEPVGADPTRGVCWELPYDYDASWGPSFNNGWDHANNGLYGHVNVSGQPYIDKPEMKIAHRNVLRSFRDLVWQEDQVGALLDDRAAFISELTMADQDRWRSAPASAGTANDDTLASKVQSMKDFAFHGWSGEFPVGPGGRGAFLDAIADNPDSGQLPATPSISYTGAAGFPTDSLEFESAGFSDPQGAGTFAAIEWRVGEIEDPGAPAWEASDDFKLENDLIWGSGELGSFASRLAVPAGALRVGHTYRARVRHKDDTGRFSHWSAPIEFTAGIPLVLGDLQANLMVTEIMYHPGALSAAELAAGFEESDFEFIELQNINTTQSLDLGGVRLTKGVDFDFDAGAMTSIPPGGFVLVVHTLAAFEMRYGQGLPVAGEWEAGMGLSNGGEQLKLSHGAGTAIRDFVYDDAAPWPTAPDGGGVSLVLVDPASAPDHALAASWRASFSPGGTPGEPEASGAFAEWMIANGFSDPLGDPQGIGLSHLLVFALGADLLPEPSAANPAVLIVTDGGQQFNAIQFRRRNSATGFSFVVESSIDLASWAEASVPFSVVDNGDGTETVTVRSSAPAGIGRHRFLRLRVSVD